LPIGADGVRARAGRDDLEPMNLVSLERAAKAYAHRTLLDGISLGVSDRDRIGIVGRNGAGKSTLLAMLAGVTAPDTGRVARASGLRVGYLPQADRLAGPVGKIVFGDATTATPWQADSLAREIAAALLPGISLDAEAERLSGGERRRVALASLLAVERDLLLLDEPTNHLDIDTIDWLGRHLRARGGLAAQGRSGCAVVVVSHDRWLLDTACDRTWEVDRGQVHSAPGGYSAYVLAQAERERAEDVAEQRRRNLARKELAWLRRGPQARGTKPKFRVQEANALIAAEPPVRDSVELTRMATARLGKTVLELDDVSVTIAGRPLLSNVTWQLGPGDRVGIVGVNGSGKTTLLRVLDGSLTADGTAASASELRGSPGRGGPERPSRIKTGKTVRLAHLSQELAELDPDQRVREAVEEVRLRIRVGDRELSAAQLLERLGFSAERQRTRVGDLSGGERRRVQMLRLLMDEPNVLLLDEPTNDLDIETLTEFEDLLDGWPGTLVVVSHDRYFLERVTDHVMALLGDGRLSFLGGGVDEYLDRVRASRGASPVAGPAERRPSSAAEERVARKELQRLERQLERLSARETELNAELAANAADYEKLVALGADLRAVRSEKAGLEDRWLNVAADLEALSLGVERGEQGPHHVREPNALLVVEPGQQRTLPLEQVGERRVHPGLPPLGERHQHPALVRWIGLTADQAGGGQPVDPVGHRPRGHQGGAHQRTGGELERRSLPAQSRQYVELPRLEAVVGERSAPGDVEVPGQPGDPAEHLERLDVQVRSLRSPGIDEFVHLVPQC
jgi:ATP-binding cassette subfamily F protein uup